jgi:hypothetical protein
MENMLKKEKDVPVFGECAKSIFAANGEYANRYTVHIIELISANFRPKPKQSKEYRN